MAYITDDDLRSALPYNALGDLTPVDPVDAGITAAVKVAAHIENAEGETDAWLGAKYTVPLTTVPRTVKQAVISIAGYHVMMASTANSEEVEIWRTRYLRAIEWLKAVSEGSIPVDGLTANGVGGSVIVSNIDDLENRFTDDLLNGGKSLAGLANRPARWA